MKRFSIALLCMMISIFLITSAGCGTTQSSDSDAAADTSVEANVDADGNDSDSDSSTNVNSPLSNDEAVKMVFDYCVANAPNVVYEYPDGFPDETTFVAVNNACTLVFDAPEHNTCLVSAGLMECALIYWVDKNDGTMKYIFGTQDDPIHYLDHIDMSDGSTDGFFGDDKAPF